VCGPIGGFWGGGGGVCASGFWGGWWLGGVCFFGRFGLWLVLMCRGGGGGWVGGFGVGGVLFFGGGLLGGRGLGFFESVGWGRLCLDHAPLFWEEVCGC